MTESDHLVSIDEIKTMLGQYGFRDARHVRRLFREGRLKRVEVYNCVTGKHEDRARLADVYELQAEFRQKQKDETCET